MERSLKWPALLVALATVFFSPTHAACFSGVVAGGAETGDRNQNRASVRYAQHFSLEYDAGYKVLRILSPWRGAKAGPTYVLVPRGAPAPKTQWNEVVIRTPVRRMVMTSTVYIPYLSLLGLEDTLVGVTHGSLISTPSIAKRYAEGKIAEIGNSSTGMTETLNMERLISLQPDLIMVYGGGDPATDFHFRLDEVGLPCVINSEYMESTPLGEAEWLKFAAAFFEKDAEAEQIVAGIASRYEQETAKARSVKVRPTVFAGMDYRGVWYMPGGGSYVAKMLADAGARYLWDDDQSQGDMTLTLEAVMFSARQADFWLDPFFGKSLAELAAFDNRYRLLRAFQERHIYNNDLRLNPAGGNDFWENGKMQPDVVLADYIHIFHPEIEPGHKFVYYHQVPEEAAH